MAEGQGSHRPRAADGRAREGGAPFGAWTPSRHRQGMADARQRRRGREGRQGNRPPRQGGRPCQRRPEQPGHRRQPHRPPRGRHSQDGTREGHRPRAGHRPRRPHLLARRPRPVRRRRQDRVAEPRRLQARHVPSAEPSAVPHRQGQQKDPKRRNGRPDGGQAVGEQGQPEPDHRLPANPGGSRRAATRTSRGHVRRRPTQQDRLQPERPQLRPTRRHEGRTSAPRGNRTPRPGDAANFPRAGRVREAPAWPYPKAPRQGGRGRNPSRRQDQARRLHHRRRQESWLHRHGRRRQFVPGGAWAAVRH